MRYLLKKAPRSKQGLSRISSLIVVSLASGMASGTAVLTSGAGALPGE